MLHKFALLSLPFVLPGCLAAQISAPAPGYVRYPDNSVRAVHGLGGSLIPLAPSLGQAIAISFSDCGGLWATVDQIQLVGPDHKIQAQYASDDSAPLLNIDRDSQSAVAWLPGSSTLLTWTGKAFSKTQVDAAVVGGPVSSVSLVSPKTARFLVTGEAAMVSAVTVSLPSGTLLSSDILPGVRGPAFEFGPYIVSVDELGLQLDGSNGIRRTLPLPEGAFPPGAFRAERMSGSWIHLFSTADARQWALNLTDTQASLSQIPAVPAGGAR